MKQKNRDYYRKNREKVLKRAKEKYDPEEAHKKWLKKKQELLNNEEKYKTWKTKMRERAKERRRKYPDRVRKLNRKSHKKLKLEVLTHYGGNPPKCACCGESHIEFLTIDHIGGRRKHKKIIRGITLYRWLRKNNFPDGFQVLCMNCNFALGKFGYCPHKIETQNL